MHLKMNITLSQFAFAFTASTLINIQFIVTDSRSSLPGLPRWLLCQDLQGRRIIVQGFGHSLSRGAFALQAIVARAFEEELCRPAQEEDAGGAEWKLPEQSRIYSSSTRHQHIHPNAWQQLQWKRQQFRWSSVLVCAGDATSNAATAQSTAGHDAYKFADRHFAPSHKRLPS